MSLNLTREPDLAEQWQMSHEQFRLLRRRHNWSCVRFSRQDIRYTDAQIEQIVRDLTVAGASQTKKPAISAGLTARSQRRSA